MEPTEVRIVVQPKDPRATEDAVEALRHWLEQQGGLDGRIRTEPRPVQPPSQSGVNDLIVQLALQGGVGTVGYLVRSLISHLASQSDSSLRTVVARGTERVEIKATGLPPERVDEIERIIAEWIHQSPEE